MKMKLKALLFAFISLIAVVILPSSASAGTWSDGLVIDIFIVSGMSPTAIHALAVTHGHPNAGKLTGSCSPVGAERNYYEVVSRPSPRPNVIGKQLFLKTQYCS